MVAGKLLVRAIYPGTGSVRVLLVGRLIRRERSAARATMNTPSSEKKARRTMAVMFFNVKSLRGFYHSVLGRSKRSLGRDVSCFRREQAQSGKALGKRAWKSSSPTH